jgi:uncharacterized membrane protein
VGPHALGRAPRTSPSRSTTIVVVTAVVVSVAVGFILSRYSDQRWWGMTLTASALVAVAAATIVVSHVRGRDAFSPLGLTALFYLASFAGGGIFFWIVRNPDVTGIAPVYDQSDVERALVLALVSFGAIVFGYVVNPLRAILPLVPSPPRFESTSQRIGILVVLLLIGWAARLEQLATGTYFHVAAASTTTTGASWFVMAASELPTLGAAFVGAQAFLTRGRGARSVRAELLFYALLCAEIGWYLPTGSRGAVLTLLTMVAVVRYYGLGRRPSLLGMLAAAAIVIFVVFPLELGYRNTEGGYQRAPTTYLRASVRDLVQQSPAEAWDNSFDSTFSRLSSITSVAAILHSGTSVLEHRSGETLVWAAETVIPRAVYTQKYDPGLFGNEFGRANGLLPPDIHQTSSAVTQCGEFYLPFGVVGMVVGMGVVGAVYRLMAEYFHRRRSDPLALAVFSVTAWSLINLQESIVAVGLFGLLKLMLFLLLVLALASRVQRVGRAPVSTRLPSGSLFLARLR